MKLIRLTKKQIILRLLLPGVLLLGGFVWLCVRACPQWRGSSDHAGDHADGRKPVS